MPTRTFDVPVAEPNVTPMIDVLLVVIIVFMVMIVQVHHTMDVALPEICQGTCATGDHIVLEVLPGPAYRLNGSAVASPEIADRLADVYRGRPDKTMQIGGRAGVRYDDVMRAMDIAKSAGVRVIGLTPKATLAQSR